MFVSGSRFASHRKTHIAIKARVRGVVCACVLTAAAAGFAQAVKPADAEQKPVAEMAALPTTGPLTAKQIGDGIWWRPVLDETSVTQVLSDMTSWGITNLYVDVFRSGETLFPSAEFPQRHDASKRDWLEHIVEEAHKRNIRVHAWAQVLCWHEPDDIVPTTHPLLIKNPDWLEVSADGFAVDGRTASRYVSPAVPEVREALVTLAKEIVRYPVDGVNLDALEYNHRADCGYNALAISRFEELHASNPSELRVDMDDDSDWMKWVFFREDNLTSVVQLISDVVADANVSGERRVMLAVNVHPGYADSRGLNRKYQNWRQWLNLGLVDATIPECFDAELPELEQQLWEARSEHMGFKVACVPGLRVDGEPTNGHPPLQEQKRLLRNAGFQHCTILNYEGLRAAMTALPEEEPKEEGGFWGLFSRD